ncbi:MAG: NAD(P)-dependent oxidoreductase [Candidatus Kerfeldbacteria bacterium CG_4_10_14_0_8_um_filter_42_10]|uniref:NAD(P)-dependent oxidoreductase n=1 Tax=Candidatus Kerfeldbacteria bacterium CG_4_10_14_0_8_um_filter_42_10 TaxID=2014248 RepID=A0A2M7RK95_9BACT|nr:MAG: NAD(P)-dependent oxidoreductase [Candidatus Kerfeldbacteria bacterium CG_4_10_14_0_8_um_filter_42_10]
MKFPKIVITGSNGRIGKILKKALSDAYDIYSIDVNRSNDNEKNYFQVDLSDLEETKKAFSSIKPSFVIHLAGQRKINGEWEDILKNNIIATRNVYECARLYGVQKIIYASSNHVTGCYEGIPPKLHEQANPKLITVKDSIRPDSYYGTSKAFAEALARQFYELFGIKSICLRIGTVTEEDNPLKDETKRWSKTWLSHRDLIQLVKNSLESDVGFGIYYGVSDNTGRFWDISNAEKELNYEPQDDASTFLK